MKLTISGSTFVCGGTAIAIEGDPDIEVSLANVDLVSKDSIIKERNGVLTIQTETGTTVSNMEEVKSSFYRRRSKKPKSK